MNKGCTVSTYIRFHVMVCAVWKCQSGHVHSGAVFIDIFDCCNSRAKMVVAAIKNYNVSEKWFGFLSTKEEGQHDVGGRKLRGATLSIRLLNYLALNGWIREQFCKRYRICHRRGVMQCSSPVGATIETVKCIRKNIPKCKTSELVSR